MFNHFVRMVRPIKVVVFTLTHTAASTQYRTIKWLYKRYIKLWMDYPSRNFHYNGEQRRHDATKLMEIVQRRLNGDLNVRST